MKIDFKLKQNILQKAGYTEEKIRNTFNWKKSVNGKDFPRYHIVIEGESQDIHIDKKRRHGFVQQWLGFTKRNNIIHDSDQLKEEIMRLRLDTYLQCLDDMRIKIIEMRNNL